MKFISTKEAPQAIGPYSQAVEVNGFIYTSGQIALTAEGVMAADDDDVETAKKYYNMAIDLDPKYTKAKMNMAALLLSQEQKIIDEMNALGSSAADDLKYDELKNSRQQLYKDAIPYLSSTLELEPNNLSAAKTLMNIYSAIDDMPNYKAMKAKVEELESKN